MNNRALYFLVVAIGTLCFQDSGIASIPYDYYNRNLPQLRQANGIYEVIVLKGDSWQRAGSIQLDKFYRENHLILPLSGLDDERIHVRLVQKGGGSAQIDAASLGGKLATEVDDVRDAGLVKLAEKDFDVLQNFGRSIEFVFNNPGPENMLSITARIEPESLVEIPFQLPMSNMYKPVGEHSQFWTYSLDSQRISPDGDFLPDAIAGKPLFFKEFLKAGSGHPSDYVYGWVMNDDENLYVIMDLTGDNTMDGDKDYAKVYVNTPNGVKMFKITQSENRWGKPFFIYTDKAAYQHKSYTFRIPFDAIGIDSNNTSASLELAFSAYGTLAPPPVTFAKSFNGPSEAPGTAILSFSITNGDANPISSLSFTDDLDAVLSGLTATNLPLNDVCGPGSSISGTSLLTFTDGNLPANGGSCTFNVEVLVPSSASAGTYPNTTSSLFSGGFTVTNPATADLVIEPPPDFSKTFTPDSTGLGMSSTLTFTLDNTASSLAATDLDFTDNLPAGVVIATPPNASTTCTGGTLTAVAGSGTITYTGGTVAAGTVCTVHADVISTFSGIFMNTTSNLTSSSGDSGIASDTLSVTQLPLFDIAFSPAAIPPGETSTLTFTIDNTSSSQTATDLDFTDNLPAGIIIATPSNASTTCTGGTLTADDGTGLISYTGGIVASIDSCEVFVDVTSNTAGNHVNVTGSLTSSAGISGTATDTLTVEERSSFLMMTIPSLLKPTGEESQAN